MKKCVVISDSFKGTLSSRDICAIAKRAIPRIFPRCLVTAIPVADGGEGTAACFEEAIGASPVSLTVGGPYGEPVTARYVKTERQAVIETASAAGLPLAEGRLDPEKTTTYGVGLLIEDAVRRGCTEILLGLGGVATNDAGAGAAAALGARFLDGEGKEFVPTGGTLEKIARVDIARTREFLKDVKITAMCDVDNPLYGERGAARVFAPQKGADARMVERLDAGLRNLSRVVRRDLGLETATIPGAGAAGGMGAGCIAFLNAELKSGIEAALDIVRFDDRLEGADLVVTGEGRLDGQSIRGKAISGIARRTRARNIPLIAIVGGVDESANQIYDLGVTAVFSVDRGALPFSQFADKSAQYYRETLEDILRLIRAAEQFRP